MKFNQSLKFNIVPEWSDHYLGYDSLKKHIYALQQKQLDMKLEFNRDETTVTNLLNDLSKSLSKTPSNLSLSSASTETKRDYVTEDSNKEEDIETTRYRSSGSKQDEILECLNRYARVLDTHHKKKQFNPLLEFTQQLISELIKIDTFFCNKNDEISNEYDNLVKDLITLNEPHIFNFLSAEIEKSDKVGKVSRTPTHFSAAEEAAEDIDSSDDEMDLDHETTALVHPKTFGIKMQKLITLKQSNKSLFIKLNELKSFVELNKIGFSKITKKFDKNLFFNIKDDFINDFLPSNSTIFQANTLNRINSQIDKLVNSFAFISHALDNSKSVESIKFELQSYLRDHIIWERNTVWKDLLSLQSKKQDFTLSPNNLHLSMKSYRIFGTHISLPRFIITWQTFKLLLTIIVFVILLTVKTFNDPAQHRCLAVLVAAAMLWATEALPLYATSMLIPLLVVTCRILKNSDGSAMEASDASAYILSTMWNSVIMILVGGFALAAALSKYNIAKVFSSWILSWVGNKPRNILLTIMMISLFLSMWISNVATPILCYSLIQPVLKTIPSNSPFAQALILGIALASNMAGMSSPISSPQNVVALESMSPNPGWGNWFAVALPVSILGTIGIWLELIFTFKINTSNIKRFQPIKDRFTVKQYFILAVTVTTILLWCVMTKIESTFGEAGIISVIPIVLFFGSGLLKTDDLNNFPWSIVLLAMGGLALGKGVTSSGLLTTIAMALQKKIMHFDVWVIMIIFGILVLVIATFVSHTVAALIIVPLVKEVGESLPSNHANLLVMGTALLASAAMGLPTSGFPNVTAISMTDELGKRYLTVNTFINRGVPASIIAFVVVITVGYGIMAALHF